jgi:hypothetical protein
VGKGLIPSLVVVFVALSPLSPAVEDLVGPVGRGAVLEHCPSWRGHVAAYQPRPVALEELRTLAREPLIEVYFGSWCSDSEVHVSEFFKVLDLLDSPLVRTAYIGIPKDKAQRAPFLQGRDILKLPTFIVLIGGREVGRIVETPERSIEEDLARLLGL